MTVECRVDPRRHRDVHAIQFVADGNVRQVDQAAVFVEETAAERLSRLASELHDRAQAVLDADGTKLKNTVKRAEQAAGIAAGTLRQLL